MLDNTINFQLTKSNSASNWLKIIPLNNQQLDDFVAKQPHSQILQSSSWAEFKKKNGQQTWQFGLVDDQNDLLASALIIEHKIFFNKSYLYCPRGPIIDLKKTPDHSLALKLFLKEIRDITITTKTTEEIFFRFEPTFDSSLKDKQLLKTKDIQPSTTLILDLSLTKDELSKNLNSKTRYNINLAQKKDISVKLGTLDDFEEAWKIFKQTSRRNSFNLHTRDHYLKMLEFKDSFKLHLAIHEQKIIAVLIAGYFGDTVTYLHGASDYQYRQLMASSYLQWEVINQAKQANYRYYDFHGIAPTDNPKHPWAGLTRFKKGFGGQIFTYPGTLDFIYQPVWYRMYKLLRKANSLLKK
jgi:peptidoglycan pentaglycine glycine transferase (the first glycine)